MASIATAFSSTLTTVTSTTAAVSAIAGTVANHAQIWEAESAAKLAERTANAALVAKAKAQTVLADTALNLLQSQKNIESQLKTSEDKARYQAILDSLKA